MPELSPGDRIALDVWRLGRRARDLAAAGDPSAPAAATAFCHAKAAVIEAGRLDLTGWLWTGLIERISQDRRSWTCGEVRRRARSRWC
jgi:hypothetical protein